MWLFKNSSVTFELPRFIWILLCVYVVLNSYNGVYNGVHEFVQDMVWLFSE